ncbi:DUF1203 domain-containing protein [Streptomyces sp. NPDC052225]|uniref:DUF1203 domain-containing protein n=1 Tax=Streptomyces sp. NPDC052225 TaxID=3154949 RepID=UPI003417D3C3
MTRYTALPIDAVALEELRTTDDAGRPCVPYTATTAEAGSPLRCCLKPVEECERIALVSYAPLRRWAAETGARPGAYDEQGPVFIHVTDEDCPGYTPDPGRYPFDRPGARRTLRRYDARGHIAGGALLEIPQNATAGFDAALDEAFADPAVVLVHVRALEYGCLHYAVRRPTAP